MELLKIILSIVFGVTVTGLSKHLNEKNENTSKTNKKAKKKKKPKYFGETEEIPYDEAFYKKAKFSTKSTTKPAINIKRRQIIFIFIYIAIAALLIFFMDKYNSRDVSMGNKATEIADSFYETGFDEDEFLKAESYYKNSMSSFLSKNDMESYGISCANLAYLYSLKWYDCYDDTYFYLAEDYYNKAADILKTNPEPYFRISYLYYSKADLVEDFEPFLQTAYKYGAFSYAIDNEDSKANWAMGNYYYKMWQYGYGDNSYYDICETYFEKALSLDSTDTKIATDLMSLYYERYENNPDDIEYFDKYNELYSLYSDLEA